MPRALYFPYMHRRLEHTLTRAVVRVAYPDAWEEDGKVFGGNSRHIIGFVVAEPSNIGLIVHYVYTRRDYAPKGGTIKACYRRNGIAKRLVEGMLRDYQMDHIIFTIWGQEMWQSETFFQKVTEEWKDKLTYNPELFTTLLPYQWETGVAATLNPDVAKAIHRTKGISPVKF
jgi:hypothetical protein